MQLLHSATRNYSWGSRTLIPHLQGQPDSDKPVAELWFGAHPGDPSTVDGRLLNEVIAEDPAGQLGSRVSAEYGERLPFLLKVLAAEEPLSLQAHPSKAQAEEGFARENSAGIELTVPPVNLCTDNGAMVAALGARLVRDGVAPSDAWFGADPGQPVEVVSV